jgi:hypothetical protein
MTAFHVEPEEPDAWTRGAEPEEPDTWTRRAEPEDLDAWTRGLPRHRSGPFRPARPPRDAAELMREINESNETVEDQCLQARDAADRAARSDRAAELAAVVAREAKVAHQSVLAEHPRRRAPLPWQAVFALLTVVLDGLACYFAAQALNAHGGLLTAGSAGCRSGHRRTRASRPGCRGSSA